MKDKTVHKPKKAKKPKQQVIQIKEEDGTIKKIGKYDPSTKTFRTTRDRSEHFMRKHNAWGLDSKVVDFLVMQLATVIVKDGESKWEFKCEAGDFKVYGILEEHKQHRPQYFLPLDHWEIIRAKNKSYVLKCGETSCRHNFGKNCLRGVISIGEDGECSNYADNF